MPRPQYANSFHFATIPAHRLTFATKVSEVTNVTSILPGTLVQSLVTSVAPSGLNLQVLGFFEGTVDIIHLPAGKSHKIGQKVKARVLYDISGTTPPRFSLALVEHIVALDIKRTSNDNRSGDKLSILDAYSIGTIVENAKVAGVESERGLVLEVEPGIEGFVHVS